MTRASKWAIIGQGNVGSAIEKGAQRAGYDVRTTGRDPAKVKELAAWGDVIVMAVPYDQREKAIEALGDVQGRVLVDVTNAVDEGAGFVGSVERSGAEEMQEWAPNAAVVKAFNTVFAQHMDSGRIQGEPLTLFVAGDDGDAKRRVSEFGGALGFAPVDAGPLENARWLETLGYFNIQLGFNVGHGDGIGFRLVGAPANGPRPEEPSARAR